MEIPIQDGSETVGQLSVREEGLYRVFRARCAKRDGVQRLWLCGGGEPVCLGVLQPSGNALVLEKRLSRSACAALPDPLVSAALSRPAPPPPAPAPAHVPAEPPGLRTIRLFGARFVVFRS